MSAIRARFALAPLHIRVAMLAAIVIIIPVSIFVIFSMQQQQEQFQDLPLQRETTQVLDTFGIQELFPTTPGGREWFMNLENPQETGGNNNVFEVSNGGQKIIRSPDDGSWYSEGAPPHYGTRIMVKSSVGHDLWMNVEMTGYFKVERTFGHPAGKSSDVQNAFQAYARGGTHSSQLMQGSDGQYKYLNCVGSGYKGRIYFDGSVNVVKEIGHSVYAPARYALTQAGSWEYSGRNQFAPLVQDYNPTDGHFYGGRWIGLKVIIFNMDPPSPLPPSSGMVAANSAESEQDWVRTLVYIDGQAEDKNGNLKPSNNWRLLADVVDAGDWAVERREIIANNNNNNATALGAAAANDSDEDEEGDHDDIDTVEELVDRCGNPFMTADEYARMIITWPGHPSFVDDPVYREISNAASFRWDYAGAKFTYLSVREIEAPPAPSSVNYPYK